MPMSVLRVAWGRGDRVERGGVRPPSRVDLVGEPSLFGDRTRSSKKVLAGSSAAGPPTGKTILTKLR